MEIVSRAMVVRLPVPSRQAIAAKELHRPASILSVFQPLPRLAQQLRLLAARTTSMLVTTSRDYTYLT